MGDLNSICNLDSNSHPCDIKYDITGLWGLECVHLLETSLWIIHWQESPSSCPQQLQEARASHLTEGEAELGPVATAAGRQVQVQCHAPLLGYPGDEKMQPSRKETLELPARDSSEEGKSLQVTSLSQDSKAKEKECAFKKGHLDSPPRLEEALPALNN